MMSGDIREGSGEGGRHKDKIEQLQSTANAVKEMVAQMQCTSMEFEGDVEDPFEQAMTVRDKGKPRPRSAQNSTQSPSRGSSRGRGRFHSFRGKKRKAPQNYHGNGTRDYDSYGYSSCGEAFVQSPRSPSARGQCNNYRSRAHGKRGNQHYYSPYDCEYPSTDASEYYEETDPSPLVTVLSECPNFSASLLQLMEKRNMSPSDVRAIASSHADVFQLRDETVVLHPKISLCKDHSGSLGCQNQSSCSDLHICPQYVTTWCNDKNCVIGHRWFTDHNKVILQSFHIKEVQVQNLRKLIQSVTAPAGPVGQLDICKEYNGQGCSKQDCDALHICQSFVAGRTKCTHSGCQLNHNILETECCQLLRSHSFSTNEAPRDVVVALISANPSLAPSASAQTDSGKETRKQQNTTPSKDIPKSNSSTATNDDQTKKENMAGNNSKIIGKSNDEGGQKKPKDVQDQQADSKPTRKAKPLRTVWSHELQADTLLAEICYYSVESTCRNEGKGCQRLHCTDHYHWQVSEQGTNWLNLCKQQVTDLENAFSDPTQDDVLLPRLDPGKLESSLKGLFTLMGRDKWQANFHAMILTNSDYSKVMYLRRLSTEAVAGNEIKTNKHGWYFKDKNNKWVQYGNVDTAGETTLVSSVTSDNIEKHYIQNPGMPLSFKNASFTYVLDFNAMTQTNQNTNVSREVRRIPEVLSTADSRGRKTRASNSSDSSDIPSTWDPMQPQERMRLVTLSSSSGEYQSVINFFNGRGASNSNIVKMERIQNPFLWKAFQNKIKEMTTVYGDIQKVDVRQLFHGTKASAVSSICAENFDWRLHGTSSGQSYGRGTYFSPNASTSLGYCGTDASGLRYLFVARVAVGSITSGNASMARPPINPSTGAPYDSTGDGANVVVKYDKQEYYPEYVITMR